jgi:hypothetical protein
VVSSLALGAAQTWLARRRRRKWHGATVTMAGLVLLVVSLALALFAAAARAAKQTGRPAALNWHWRQQIHPIPAVANSKDASGIVYTANDGYWHVMMDCSGGYSGDFGGWCHQRSRDVLHWEEMPLALGLDPSDPCQPLGLDTGSIAILPDGRPFAVYGTFNQSSKFGPRQVFDGNICMVKPPPTS